MAGGMFIRITALACVALVTFFTAQAQGATTPLIIASADVEQTFRVELANSQAEIQRGLMQRTEMAPDAGMLFDFGGPQDASMWMKDTALPLDMLFIAPDGQILAIAHDTLPGSLRQIRPGVVVKAVLELNAGRTQELGIRPGDRVRHAIFNNVNG